MPAVRVLSSLALKGVLEKTRPSLERAVGPLELRFDATQAIEALRAALGAAASVAHSKVGASGLYFAALLERLDVALKKRVVVEKGPVGLAVAAGEAELGVQQLCELAPVPGIEVVGPLPAPLQTLTWFCAGIPAGAANAQGARALAGLLRSEALRAIMAEGGLQPAD